MMLPHAPLGVYDSGIGGLTVWKALRTQTHESVLYFGDTIHLPYGDKTKEQILQFSREILAFFMERNVKAVVVACNTSSAIAFDIVRKEVPMPLFDVIRPAVLGSTQVSKSRVIGLFATNGTVQSGRYQRILKELAPDCALSEVACPLLVPLIEQGLWEGQEVEEVLKGYLSKLHPRVDTLILGCTHYPLLGPVLNYLAPNLSLVDPSYQTALNVQHYLRALGLVNKGSRGDKFYVSGDPVVFSALAEKTIGVPLPFVHTWNRE